MLSVCKKLTPGSRMKYKDEPYLQFFFLSGFSFTNMEFTGQQGKGEAIYLKCKTFLRLGMYMLSKLLKIL